MTALLHVTIRPYDPQRHSVDQLRRIWRAGQREIPREARRRLFNTCIVANHRLLMGLLALCRILLPWQTLLAIVLAVGAACVAVVAYFALLTELYIRRCELDDWPHLTATYNAPGTLLVAELDTAATAADSGNTKSATSVTVVVGMVALDARPAAASVAQLDPACLKQLHQPLMELRRLAVDPHQRNLRIGTQLIRAALQHAHNSGARTVFLTCLGDQPVAIHAYTRAGFELSRQVKQEWRPGVVVHAYVKRLEK